jgi:hypothetical protein
MPANRNVRFLPTEDVGCREPSLMQHRAYAENGLGTMLRNPPEKLLRASKQ